VTRIILLAALALAVALADGVRAQFRASKKADLEAAVTKLAAGIQERLKDRGQDAVSIGEFVGPNKLKINISARLRSDLEKQLKARKVTVRDEAKLEVRGDYTLVEDPEQADLHALVLKARFIDTDSSAEIAGLNLEASIKDNLDLAKMTGGTTSVPVNANGHEFNKYITDAVKEPQVAVAHSKVRAKADSPYAIELLLASDPQKFGQPQPAKELGGRAFVDVPRNAYYQIRLHNAAQYQAAATVTIDGLDLFTFSEDVDAKTGKSRFKYVIIPPGRSVTLKGWPKAAGPGGRGQAYSFLVTALGHGAASQRKVSGSTGVITATFAAAWEKDGTPPADERDRPRSVGGNETTTGPVVEAGMKPVEATVGVVRDVVSVRYSR
jgi:hypothetical protein